MNIVGVLEAAAAATTIVGFILLGFAAIFGKYQSQQMTAAKGLIEMRDKELVDLAKDRDLYKGRAEQLQRERDGLMREKYGEEGYRWPLS